MKRVMLIYPPGKAYQRSEDRAQCNIDESVVPLLVPAMISDMQRLC